MNNLGKEMLQLRNHPNIRAMLDWITRAEHGRISAENYSRAYGNTKIGLDKYPNRKFAIRNKNGSTSSASASGAYQINKVTWNDIAPKLGLTDFGRDAQDAAAIYLMKQRGMLDDVLNGYIATAIQKMGDKNVWAAMPSHKQATVTWDQAKKHFADYGIAVKDVFPKNGGRVSNIKQTDTKQTDTAVNTLFTQQLLADNARALAADEGFTLPGLDASMGMPSQALPDMMNPPDSAAGIEQSLIPKTKTQTLVEAFADILPNAPFLDQASFDQFIAEAQTQEDDARNASVTSFISGGRQAPATMEMPAPLRREINKIIANLQD